MIVADDNHAADALRRVDDSFDTLGRERQRPLAQHVNFRAKRTENMRLVEMIRRCDDHRVDSILLEKLLHVGVDIGNAEALRERARFHPVVVADCNESSSLDLREEWKMCELCDCTGAHERET
jgi:hypothetical protein